MLTVFIAMEGILVFLVYTEPNVEGSVAMLQLFLKANAALFGLLAVSALLVFFGVKASDEYIND